MLARKNAQSQSCIIDVREYIYSVLKKYQLFINEESCYEKS